MPPDFLYKQLSKFPLGLLKWFGIPSGSNPQEIETSYKPVLDLWEWIASTNSLAFQGGGSVIAPGAAGTQLLQGLTSPDIQYVLDYTIRSTPVGVGGGDLLVVPTIQHQAGSGVEVAVGPPEGTYATGAGSAGEVIVARNSQPFFMGPNSIGYSSIIRKNTLANAITLFPYFRYVTLSQP